MFGRQRIRRFASSTIGTALSAARAAAEMVVVKLTMHPRSLHPLQAARAHTLRHDEELPWSQITPQVVNLAGEEPSITAVRDAVERIDEQGNAGVVPQLKYANCGRTRELTAARCKEVVDFVKKWRLKRFCTCGYIRQELKLKVHVRTIRRVLNRAGYSWTAVPKQAGFGKESLRTRTEFVAKYGGKSSAWWEENLNLCLDGVTLTMPPKPLSGRQKHAAQAVKHLWMKDGEKFDSRLPTYNRYGVQLGI